MSAAGDLGALLLADLDVLHHRFELTFIDRRPHVDAVVQTVADAQRADIRAEAPVHERRVDEGQVVGADDQRLVGSGGLLVKGPDLGEVVDPPAADEAHRADADVVEGQEQQPAEEAADRRLDRRDEAGRTGRGARGVRRVFGWDQDVARGLVHARASRRLA